VARKKGETYLPTAFYNVRYVPFVEGTGIKVVLFYFVYYVCFIVSNNSAGTWTKCTTKFHVSCFCERLAPTSEAVQSVRPPEVWEHIAFERDIHSTVWYCHLMLSEGWFLSCDVVVPLTSAANRNNQMNAVETTENCWLSCRSSRQISCGDVNWNHKANVQRSRRDVSSPVYVCGEQRQSGHAFRNGTLFSNLGTVHVQETQLQIMFLWRVFQKI
jgi:hypothetical protein